MKLDRRYLINFLLLVLVASLYRAMPGRPWGFAPQIAMALFAGAVISDKKLAFAFPLVSMFLSDLFYQTLYWADLTAIPGFYSGQFVNYLLLTSITIFGFYIKTDNLLSLAKGFISGPTAFFIISNFLVWAGNGGYHRPMTFDGLMMCYADGLPFYGMSIFSTFVFGSGLFLAHRLILPAITPTKD